MDSTFPVAVELDGTTHTVSITVGPIEHRTEPTGSEAPGPDWSPHGAAGPRGGEAVTFFLSRLKGEQEWVIDAKFGPNGMPHFCHGFGSRVTIAKTVIPRWPTSWTTSYATGDRGAHRRRESPWTSPADAAPPCGGAAPGAPARQTHHQAIQHSAVCDAAELRRARPPRQRSARERHHRDPARRTPEQHHPHVPDRGLRRGRPLPRRFPCWSRNRTHLPVAPACMPSPPDSPTAPARSTWTARPPQSTSARHSPWNHPRGTGRRAGHRPVPARTQAHTVEHHQRRPGPGTPRRTRLEPLEGYPERTTGGACGASAAGPEHAGGRTCVAATTTTLRAPRTGMRVASRWHGTPRPSPASTPRQPPARARPVTTPPPTRQRRRRSGPAQVR